MLQVNKYMVKMTQFGDTKFSKSMSTVIASSPEEAIDKVRREPFWYDEGTGIRWKKIYYPVTFEAKINNS